jgi:hypothetical protein
MKKKKLKVCTDFCSTGIWNFKTQSMIEYSELPISTELKERFEDWIWNYDTKFTSKKTYLLLKRFEKRHNREGIRLANELKKELPTFEIYYLPEYNQTLGNSERIK